MILDDPLRPWRKGRKWDTIVAIRFIQACHLLKNSGNLLKLCIKLRFFVYNFLRSQVHLCEHNDQVHPYWSEQKKVVKWSCFFLILGLCFTIVAANYFTLLGCQGQMKVPSVQAAIILIFSYCLVCLYTDYVWKV